MRNNKLLLIFGLTALFCSPTQALNKKREVKKEPKKLMKIPTKIVTEKKQEVLIDQLKKQLKVLTEKNNNSKKKIDQAREELKKLKQKPLTPEESVEQYKTIELDRLKSKVKKYKNIIKPKHKKQGNRISELEIAIKRLKEENNNYSKKLIRVVEKKKKYKDELSTIKEKLSKLKNDFDYLEKHPYSAYKWQIAEAFHKQFSTIFGSIITPWGVIGIISFLIHNHHRMQKR